MNETQIMIVAGSVIAMVLMYVWHESIYDDFKKMK